MEEPTVLGRDGRHGASDQKARKDAEIPGSGACYCAIVGHRGSDDVRKRESRDDTMIFACPCWKVDETGWEERKPDCHILCLCYAQVTLA